MVYFLKGLRGILLCMGENKTSNPVCIDLCKGVRGQTYPWKSNLAAKNIVLICDGVRGFTGSKSSAGFCCTLDHHRHDTRDFKMREWKQRREWQRAIAFNTEYNSSTLECSELITYLLSSSIIRHGKLNLWVLWKTWKSNNKIWQSLYVLEAEPFTFFCLKISCKVEMVNFSQKINEK